MHNFHNLLGIFRGVLNGLWKCFFRVFVLFQTNPDVVHIFMAILKETQTSASPAEIGNTLDINTSRFTIGFTGNTVDINKTSFTIPVSSNTVDINSSDSTISATVEIFRAYFRLCDQLNLLRKFVVLNYVAVAKIVKKLDKNTGQVIKKIRTRKIVLL